MINNNLTHNGSGDLFLGGKYVTLQNITAENLFPIAEDIFRMIRSDEIGKAKTAIDTINKLPADIVAKRFVDALNIAIEAFNNDIIPEHSDLYSLAGEDDLSEKLKDIVFAIIMLIECKNKNDELANAIFNQSPKKKYSHMFYLQCLAKKEEIDAYWNTHRVMIDDDNLYALSIGAARIKDWEMAKAYVQQLKDRNPSKSNNILSTYIHVTALAEKYQNIDLFSQEKNIYNEIISNINNVIHLLEEESNNKFLFYALSNLLLLTQSNHYQLIQVALKNKEIIHKLNPSTSDYLDEIGNVSEKETLLFDINSDNELTSPLLITLLKASTNGSYIKESIQSLVLATKLKTTNDIQSLHFNYQLASLKVKLLIASKNNLIEKQKIKQDIIQFISTNDISSLVGYALISFCNDLLTLGFPEECCNFMEPRLPHKLWPSDLVITYFNALIRAEKFSTLSECLNSIEVSEWDHNIWLFQSKIHILHDEWIQARDSLEKSISLNNMNPYAWSLLIQCESKINDKNINAILDAIPKNIFNDIDHYNFQLLRDIADKIDPHYTEQIMANLFITAPMKYAAPMFQLHTLSLSGDMERKAQEYNIRPLDKVIRSIKLLRNNIEEEIIIADIEKSKQQGCLLSVHSEFGSILCDSPVGKKLTYAMDYIEITEEVNAYHILFRYILKIITSPSHASFPIRKFDLSPEPEKWLDEMKNQLAGYNHSEREHLISSSDNMPLYLKGHLLDKNNPVKAALQLFSTSESNQSFSWPSGDIDSPETFITDVYGLIYLALTRTDIELCKNKHELLITNETHTCITNWLKETENPNYLTMHINDDKLYRTTAREIQDITKSIRIALRNLLEYAEIKIVPIQNTPTELRNMKEFFDASVYSTIKYSLFTYTPYFIMDNMIEILIKKINNNITTINSTKFLPKLLHAIPVIYKVESYYRHLMVNLPVFVSYDDTIDLASSENADHIELAAKLLKRYSTSFNNLESACYIMAKILTKQLSLAFINNAYSFRYQEPIFDNHVSIIFNACCQVIIDTNDGSTSEERLVGFIRYILSNPAFPLKYIDLLLSLFHTYATGHFLDVNYMNSLIRHANGPATEVS
ncbi:hypothetical protein [Hafnia sp. HMSC23F03]|uniref:PIN domain-containing protein n=1 Tax=Hafnia sp. HMSC23F03 TaxID=1581059 RepID=UPI0008A52048|nr:hypothetical protein [Hafnia sp. HMSC23F03]OFS11083.1 hypothetical protein HMPREF3091_07340 [Hafnia sp. HMSC23F03]